MPIQAVGTALYGGGCGGLRDRRAEGLLPDYPLVKSCSKVCPASLIFSLQFFAVNQYGYVFISLKSGELTAGSRINTEVFRGWVRRLGKPELSDCRIKVQLFCEIQRTYTARYGRCMKMGNAQKEPLEKQVAPVYNLIRKVDRTRSSDLPSVNLIS